MPPYDTITQRVKLDSYKFEETANIMLAGTQASLVNVTAFRMSLPDAVLSKLDSREHYNKHLSQLAAPDGSLYKSTRLEDRQRKTAVAGPSVKRDYQALVRCAVYWTVQGTTTFPSDRPRPNSSRCCALGCPNQRSSAKGWANSCSA